MRWEDGRESDNVEDRRGFPIGGRGASLGCGGLLLILVISWLTGVSPLRLLEMVQGSSSEAPPVSSSAPAPAAPAAPGDRLGKFASVVLASTEDVWKDVFAKNGKPYEPPKLVLFTGAARSGCGLASTQVGPFYCEVDRKVYLDLSFFRELSERFGAPGEFADAYVIAHEVGHHVQNSLGLFERVGRDRSRDNAVSVRIELQADCFAGVWGYHANRRQHLIEPGDFEQGLHAAAAIGDDRMQRMSSDHVAPETFTHGTSQDRVGWLRRGLTTGDPGQCDTFQSGDRERVGR
jgi:predicted metalloprotease